MKISRRDFLKGMFSAAVIATIPKPALEAFVSGEVDTVVAGNFTIDAAAKTIGYTGGEGQFSVMELYRWMADQFDEYDMIDKDLPAMRAHTPHMIEMRDGWRITEETMGHLTDGSIKMDDEVWSNIAVRVRD